MKINEYTSRYISDENNFRIRAYHTVRRDSIYNVFCDGYLDPKAEHKGECPYDIIWFTIRNDDYDGLNRFSFDIDENTWKEFNFKWMNDIHPVTPNKIDLMDKRLRIEKINGVNIDKLYKKYYNNTKEGLDKFIDKACELSNYELSNESFIMKLLQQYGFKPSDWFDEDYLNALTDEEKNNYRMNESINQPNVEYYGLFIDDVSKRKLMSLVPEDAYKVYCDHMTIAHKSKFNDEIVEKCESLVGKQFEVMATHIGVSKDVMAVGVETNCFSFNKIKHITLCTLSPKGKPVQSNFITDWRELETPILLNGVVKPFIVGGLKEQKKYVRQGVIPYGDGEACIAENEQLNEVDADDINLKSFEVQDELNPKFWINDKINSKVRLKLLDLADEFYDSLNIKWVKPKDIVLTGSIANYNWSKYSDVDVHILVDFKEVWKKTEFVQDYFDSKKALWSQEHEGLTIYGFPVEMYVEDSNQKNPNSGIYSLNKNKWLVEPNDFQDAELNEDYIKKRSAKIMNMIDDIEDDIKKEKDNHKLEVLSTKMKNLFDKLHRQRKESLEKHGEMGTYNIIWKVLRRTEYLDKMWDIINNVYNKINSIK